MIIIKNNNILMLLLFCFTLITSCNSVQEVELDYDNDSLIKINVSEAVFLKDERLSSLISSYEYIALETNESSLMGGVTSLVVRDDRIFVYDRITKSILIFDRTGKYISRLESGGLGPKEFSDIVSFTIDDDMKHIIIGASGKVIAFDFSGNYQYEIKTILGGAFQIVYTGERKLAIYTNYIPLDESQGFNHVAILDLDSKEIVARAIPFNKLSRVEVMTGFFNNISNSSSDSKFLSIPYKNYVWQLRADEVIPAYYIDFGENNLPEDFEEEYLASPRYTAAQIRDVEVQNDWQRVKGGGVTFNDSFLNFSYAVKGKYHHLYYDLKTRNSFKFKTPLSNDLDGSNSIVQRASFQDQFVSVLTPGGIINRAREGKIKDSKIIEFSKGLKVEDNPVLLFLKFKSIKNEK